MISLDATRDLLHLLGDPTRVRLVRLLGHQELAVAEITAITGLAQSRVSTHLAKLKEGGVLRDRRNGTSTVYAVNDQGAMPPETRAVWALVDRELADPILAGDRVRCDALVRARRRRGAWPDSLAGEMERHYSPGRTWEATARAFVGLVRLGDVLDAGCGDGTIAQLLAPRARSFTCLDVSARLLEAARVRLAASPNVRVARGDVAALPAAAGSFDQVLLLNVLTHVPAPARALGEAARVLRRGGSLVLVTLEAHRHAPLAATYGHVHAGFKPAYLRSMLTRAGLEIDRCEVTSRERREPHFGVLTVFAHKPA